MTTPTIRFKNDAVTRKRLMVPESFQHPAKGQLGMWALMIEKYSQPGDTVLDPMSGSGATLLAALMGRNVICVELEAHFLRTMTGYDCDGIVGIKREWVESEQEGWYVRAGFGGDTRVFAVEAEAQAFYGERMVQEGDVRGEPEFRPGIEAHWEAISIPAMCGKVVSHAPHRVIGSWEKMRTMPMLGFTMGEATIIQGDARNLGQVLADCVITSPPFSDQLPVQDREFIKSYERRDGSPAGFGKALSSGGYTRPVDAIVTSPPYEDRVANDSQRTFARTGVLVGMNEGDGQTYGNGQNIGNQRGGDLYALLVYNRLRREPKSEVEVYLCGQCTPALIVAYLLAEGGLNDARHVPLLSIAEPTITSGEGVVPTGEGLLGIGSDKQCVNETTTPVQDVALRMGLLSIISKMQSKLEVNGITASQIWLRSVAPVTTENTQLSGCILCNVSLAGSPSNQGTPTPFVALRLRFVTPNIVPLSVLAGEQKGNYWLSMLQVYEECFRVLKPQGVMALVLKGFTRDGKYVDLPGQTEAMLLEAGWVKHDEWRRELWGLSFWRILQKRRDPAAFDNRLMYETVLAFRKPEGEGNGVVQTVITSPPYEGNVSDNQEGPSAGASESRFGRWSKGTANKHGGYTRPVDVILSSPPYEGTGLGESGIDLTKFQDGRDRTGEDKLQAGQKGYSQ